MLIPPPLSSLIPDKNKLITINLIRMIFILLWFRAGRKDHLPGVYRRHSWQAALLRYLSGYVGWPRSAHDATQVTPLCDCARLLAFVKRGTISLRCAQNYHLSNYRCPSDKLTNLTLTLHFITCKISVSQWLRLHCSLIGSSSSSLNPIPTTYYPDNYRYPSVIVLLVSVSARGRKE